MPETPDFDQVARRLANDGSESGIVDDEHTHAIADQLRLMWNARGAADLAKIDAVLAPTAAAPYVKTMNHAIRGLDR